MRRPGGFFYRLRERKLSKRVFFCVYRSKAQVLNRDFCYEKSDFERLTQNIALNFLVKMSECSYHNNIFFSLISKKNKNERFSIIGRFIALVGDCDSTVENLEDAKLLRHFWKDPGPFRHSVRHSLSRSFCSLCLTIQYRLGSTFIL